MKNKLKQLLAAGKPALGSWIGFADPYAVEIVADAGFDWLLVDMEHFPLSKESLRTILMACKGSPSVPIVRVPVNSSDYIQAALDLGAQGVMVPMINRAADAKQAVEFSRYPPLGRRGFGPIRASRYFEDSKEYRREANDETVLFVQVETPEAIANARDTLAIQGIDGVFVGNGDLANFVNHGEAGSEAVQKIVDDMIATACGLSIPVGLPVWSPEECDRYVQRGATLLTIGSDMSFLHRATRSELSDFRKAVQPFVATHKP